jgi:diaminopimelate decarboxylase
MDHFAYQGDQLAAEQVPLSEIAEAYGTPCYVYSRATLTRHWHAFDKAFGARPHLICFAVKANSNLAVLDVLARLGAGFDIVSVGELERIAATAAEFGCVAPVSLRVNPDVDAQSHPYISTGLKENKFGIDIAAAEGVYQVAAEHPALRVVGIDCHIGSQLTSLAPFIDALDRVLLLADRLAAQGIEIEHLDLGGGLGIRYTQESPPEPDAYAAALSERLGERRYEVILEPGRAIAGNAGVLLTRVEYMKRTPTHRFAIVDAAMNDLLRPALYGAEQEIVPVRRAADVATEPVEIVGPVCETGDFLGRERRLALAEGDLLAIRGSGAYGFSMSSNYNSRPRAAEVMVDGDQTYLVRARESLESLFAGERTLP